MPQSERSQIIKAILSWLYARNKQHKAPRLAEAIRYIESEITDMGASPKTVRRYLERLAVHGMVSIEGGKVICTQTGKNWLEKKVS